MVAIMCLERYLNKFLITYAHYECVTSDFGSHLKSFLDGMLFNKRPPNDAMNI